VKAEYELNRLFQSFEHEAELIAVFQLETKHNKNVIYRRKK
jgi:hypothetical protein